MVKGDENVPIVIQFYPSFMQKMLVPHTTPPKAMGTAATKTPEPNIMREPSEVDLNMTEEEERSRGAVATQGPLNFIIPKFRTSMIINDMPAVHVERFHIEQDDAMFPPVEEKEVVLQLPFNATS